MTNSKGMKDQGKIRAFINAITWMRGFGLLTPQDDKGFFSNTIVKWIVTTFRKAQVNDNSRSI